MSSRGKKKKHSTQKMNNPKQANINEKKPTTPTKKQTKPCRTNKNPNQTTQRKPLKRTFQFKGALDFRLSYTNPVVYLNMANLPCILSESQSYLFPALTPPQPVTFQCPLAVSVLLFVKLCCKKDQHNAAS